MSPNPFWIGFDRTNHGHHTPLGWRRMFPGLDWRAGARAYTRQYGECRTLLADGRVLRYLWDGTRIRQRTYTKVSHVS